VLGHCNANLTLPFTKKPSQASAHWPVSGLVIECMLTVASADRTCAINMSHDILLLKSFYKDSTALPVAGPSGQHAEADGCSEPE